MLIGFLPPLRGLLTVVFAISLVSGCQKRRPTEFVQGVGDNLYEIEAFDQKTLSVITGERRFKGQTSRADKIEIVDNFDGINSLDSVDFEIPEGLFSGIDISDFYFYGKSKTSYDLQYSFTDSNIILSKVAHKQDIPSQELTFAKKLADGRYSVPMMGLPIRLYSVEKVLDGRGKPTNQKSTFSKDFLSEATHFKVNKESIVYFKAPVKLDMLPSAFFSESDEWVYTKTLVGRAIDSQSILGNTPSALKIKFVKTNNSILGVDLNIAKEQEVLDPTKTIVALEIPVEWVDFKLNKTGSSAYLEENSLDDDASGVRFWKDRQYALIDFNNADRLGKSKTQDNKLEKLEIGQNYFSFTIYESTSGNTYKYSLKKDNRTLPGQQIFADDKKIFHIFSERRNVIDGALYRQDADFDKLNYAARMFPENGEIVFNITKNTPTDPLYLEAIQASIDAWDVAFQKAETGIRVKLAKERVELGDVRYNQISFYGYEVDSSMRGGGTLLGFGPSVQDTRNGVTHSASTHIYLRAYREGVIRSVRNFVRNELGLYEDKVIKGIPLIEASDDSLSGGSLISSGIHEALAEETTLFDLDRETLFSPDPQGKAKQHFIADGSKHDALPFARLGNQEGSCSYGAVASSSNNWEKIRVQCLQGNSKLDDYMKRLQAAHSDDESILNVAGEEDAVLSCAQNLMKDTLISTLIHEIGHNLGLGHNFAASSDGVNFARHQDGTVAFPSSSVMDYPDRDFDLFSEAGPYDIAAIRYLYGRQVELANGKKVKLTEKKSILDSLKEAGLGKADLKPYRMCTDLENNSNSPLFDPMCRKWDVGSKPQEFVKWAISQIHGSIIQNGYVYNNKVFTGYVGTSSYMFGFRQIYEYWRYLIYNYPGIGRYLEDAGREAEALEAIVAREEALGNLEFRNYYEASQLIFEFLLDVVFHPMKICAVTKEDGSVEPVEFRKFRSDTFVKANVTLQNCKEATPYLLESVEGAKSVEEFGEVVNSLELDLDPAVLADKIRGAETWSDLNAGLNPIYSYGFGDVKSQAIAVLMMKMPSLQANINRNFFPSMMDNGKYNKIVGEEIMSRILYGMKAEKLNSKGLPYPFFKEEQSVYTNALINYMTAADSFNSASSPISRSFRPIVKKDQKASQYAGASDTVYRYDRRNHLNYATTSRNPNMYALINRLNTLWQVVAIMDQNRADRVTESIVTALEESREDLSKEHQELSTQDFAKALATRMVDVMAVHELFFNAEQFKLFVSIIAQRSSPVEEDGKASLESMMEAVPLAFGDFKNILFGLVEYSGVDENGQPVLGPSQDFLTASRGLEYGENFSAQLGMLYFFTDYFADQ